MGRCKLTVESNCRFENSRKGHKISTGAPDIIALKFMNPLIGMEGFSVYYHTLPQNDINKWLVEEHKNASMKFRIYLRQEACLQPSQL